MHLSFGVLFATSALQILAQIPTAQSPPFNLVLQSTNSSVNGSTLYSCHEGAAIEALCLTRNASFAKTTYHLNYTSQQTVDPELGFVGFLSWVLRGTNFSISSPMKLTFDPISNVAIPIFSPYSVDGTAVGFDKNEMMYIPGYTSSDLWLSHRPNVVKFYNWFVCETNAGYEYTTLAWVVGIAAVPQNPTCQKVEVQRSFT